MRIYHCNNCKHKGTLKEFEEIDRCEVCGSVNVVVYENNKEELKGGEIKMVKEKKESQIDLDGKKVNIKKEECEATAKFLLETLKTRGIDEKDYKRILGRAYKLSKK